MPGHFHLDKWYLDAVREDGSGVILYDAAVRWKFIRIRYYNRLEFDQLGNSRHSVSLRRRLILNVQEKSAEATDGAITARWSKSSSGFSVDLLNRADGMIRWNCLYPNSAVTIASKDGETSARGYVEQLIMTIDPWKFNIDELYWGRFCSSNNSVVWIEWRGEIARKWLFHNGQLIEDFQLTDDALVCQRFNLNLSNKSTIRAGSLINTVFKSFRWLRFIFPGKTIFSDEIKWCASAVMTADGVNCLGFSIFEKVIWVK
jgi:hypothetical protein